jgi:hypothetical protein
VAAVYLVANLEWDTMDKLHVMFVSPRDHLTERAVVLGSGNRSSAPFGLPGQISPGDFRPAR